MPHTAQIPSHRKPRRSASRMALRAGVASGVLGTLAVAGASGSASAAEPVTETIEMPTLTANLSAAMLAAADSTQQMATSYELQAGQDAAVAKAAKEAKADREKAEKKAAAKAAAKAEAKRKAAEKAAAERAAEQEAASRSTARTTLAPQSTGTSTASAGTAQVASAPASGSAASVIAFLKSHLGDAYVMGGTGPHSWDCSGLTQAAFRTVGIDLPRTSQEQSTAGTQVPVSSAQPGDLLYWGGAGSAYHVGVYIGNGQYLDAANPGKGVVVQDLSGYPASGAIRLL
ncbi:C40 family peptidase [Streptomyces sp. CA-253872]|uniref:C40 family peptidase n=1 Tax=Streptomyces sp. CA-253872 TaxID=3240067 RepID=UPI003D93EF43